MKSDRGFTIALAAMVILAIPGVVYAESVGATGSLDAYGVLGSRMLRMSTPSKAVVGPDLKEQTSFQIEAQKGSIGKLEVNPILLNDPSQLSWSDLHGDNTTVFVTKDGKSYSCKLTDGFPSGFVCPIGLEQGQEATVHMETGVTANWDASGFYVWVSDADHNFLEEPVKGTGAGFKSILPLAQVDVAEALAPGDCLVTRKVSGLRADGTMYTHTTTDVEVCN